MTLRDRTYCATAGQGLCINRECSRYSTTANLWAEFKADGCGYVESEIWDELKIATGEKK